MSGEEENEEYFRTPEFRKALARYEDAMRQGEPVYMEADELTDIAEYYMTKEREQDADKVIDLALALHPGSVDPQVFLARRQLFVGNIREAWQISRAIVDQEDLEVKYLNAEILIKEGRSREAVAHLLGVWRNLEDDRAQFLYDSAGIFMDYNLWEYSMMWVNRLERLYPKFPKTKRMKTELMVCMGRYDQAIPLLNEILDDNPYDQEAWNLLAESQGASELFAEAVDSAEYVLAIDKDNQRAIVTKASCLFHMNQPQEAHLLYQKYLANTPDDTNVLYLDAVCLASIEQYDEALRAVTRALEMCSDDTPQYVHILLEKAYVESKLHHAEQAVETIALAESMHVEDIDCEYSLLKGQILLENGKEDEAVKCFVEALRVSPDKRNTLMLIAIAHGDCEHYAEAVEMMHTIMHSFPADDAPSPVPYLAYYYYMMNDAPSCLTFLKQAVQVDRQTTEHLFSPLYPGVTPDEYYLYIFRNFYGSFPSAEDM
ncbi:MAG: tetratricopeptide repeat protein [Bacteroidaceae bacterium]